MTQTLAISEKNLTSNFSGQILCFHINTTNQVQIIRITNIPAWQFERVVFPGQRLMFEAVPEAKLEICTSEKNSTTISYVIPCQQLRVIETFFEQ
jgi:hypothetical protein